MKRDVEHQRDLYNRIIENESFKKETAAVGEAFRNSIWWVSETGDRICKTAAGRSGCEICARSRSNRTICRKLIRDVIKRVKKSKAAVDFDCGSA